MNISFLTDRCTSCVYAVIELHRRVDLWGPDGSHPWQLCLVKLIHHRMQLSNSIPTVFSMKGYTSISPQTHSSFVLLTLDRESASDSSLLIMRLLSSSSGCCSDLVGLGSIKRRTRTPRQNGPRGLERNLLRRYDPPRI